jgi:hypothetical protein
VEQGAPLTPRGRILWTKKRRSIRSIPMCEAC